MNGLAHWSERQDILRVLKHDTKQMGVDIFYGAAYVVAGVTYALLTANTVQQLIGIPTLVLWFVITYLASRICGPECSSATFFANLPRRRILSFWTHIGVLMAITLPLHLIIFAALWIKAHLLSETATGGVSPLLVLVPYLTIAAVSWLIYTATSKPRLVAMLWLGISIPVFVIVVTFITALPVIGETFFLVLLGMLMLFDAARSWRAVQIGELQ